MRLFFCSVWVAIFVASLAHAEGWVELGESRHLLFEKFTDVSTDSLPHIRGIQPYSARYLDHYLEGEAEDERNWWTSLAQSKTLQRGHSVQTSADGFFFDAELRTGYAFLRSPTTRALQIDAITNPLLEQGAFNSEARFNSDGNHFFLEPEFSLGVDDYFVLEFAPLVTVHSKDDSLQDRADFWVQRLSGIFRLNKLSVEVGRSTVRWGVGRIGTMMFSGENRPLDLVRVRNDLPVRLPSFLEHLGPFVFDGFVARMDDGRFFAHSYVVGSKFAFMPTEDLELGFAYTVLFGGEGSPTSSPAVYFADFLSDANGVANRNFVLDFRYRFEGLGIEPYAEILFEDCCAGMLINARDVQNLVGVYFPRIDPEGKVDLALEWIRTNHITYRHGAFLSGFTFRDRVLGHVLGPDGMGIYAKLRHFVNERWIWSMTPGYEIRGRLGKGIGSNPITDIHPRYEVPEQRMRFLSDIRWNPSFDGKRALGFKDLWLTLEFGFEWVTAHDYNQGTEQKNVLFGLTAESHF